MKNSIGVPAIIGGVVALLAVVGAIYYFAMKSDSGSTVGNTPPPAGATSISAGQKKGEEYGAQVAKQMQNQHRPR
jgi:hypothetical protein